MVGPSVLQIPGVPGGPEVLIILLIIVLLFGADKIPQLAGALGEARAEFDKSRKEVENELTQMQEQDNGVQSNPNTSELTSPNESTEAESQTKPVEHDSPEVNENNTKAKSE